MSSDERRSTPAIVSRVAIAALLAVVTASLLAAPALGDADPASDVLLGENVFYPYNPPVSPALEARLNAKAAAAHLARLPIKVALIASPIDLGAIPTFFGRPKQYAAFLDQEISFGNGRVPLLVVMPNGYGTAGLPSAASAAVDSLPRPITTTANALAQAAIAALPRLAAAAGRPLRGSGTGSAGDGGGPGVALPLAILAAASVGLAVAIQVVRRRRAPPRGHRR